MRSAALCRCRSHRRRLGRWRRERVARRRRDRLVVLLLCALPVLAVLPAVPGPGAVDAAGRYPAISSADGRTRVADSAAPAAARVPGPHAERAVDGTSDKAPHPPGRSPATVSGTVPGSPSTGPSGSNPVRPPATPFLSTGAVVARLYAEAAKASEAYERGRRAADGQRARAARLERLLTGRRRDLALIRSDLGRAARAEYRTGGAGLSHTAQLLLADDPGELLRGRRLARQVDSAMTALLHRARRAERTLAEGKRRARTAWHDLDLRTARLAVVKRGIADKLESARWQLQSEADRSVAAGKCAGAVRVGRPGGQADGRSWVAPVREYVLSAGFADAGAHWARRHTGQDFAVDIGVPVRSVGAGQVVSVSCGGAFGIEVVVRHADGYYTQYAHLAGVTVDQGDRVHAGQWVGQAGTTGNSTGPHLHFEVRLTPGQGSAVDPVRWLKEHNVNL